MRLTGTKHCGLSASAQLPHENLTESLTFTDSHVQIFCCLGLLISLTARIVTRYTLAPTTTCPHADVLNLWLAATPDLAAARPVLAIELAFDFMKLITQNPDASRRRKYSTIHMATKEVGVVGGSKPPKSTPSPRHFQVTSGF